MVKIIPVIARFFLDDFMPNIPKTIVRLLIINPIKTYNTQQLPKYQHCHKCYLLGLTKLTKLENL